MARPANLYNHVLGNSKWLAFEKGVDAGRKWGREELRELLADKPFDRRDSLWPIDRYYLEDDEMVCTCCARLQGEGHEEQCVWPKIDKLLALEALL